MNQEEFEQVFSHMFEQSREVLVQKAREYASDTDRLHNFKAASGLLGGTPEQACWGFAVKHLVSISDMVRNGKDYHAEVWDEKIGDALNYLILLRALVFASDYEIAGQPLLETFTVGSLPTVHLKDASNPNRTQE